MLFKSNIKIHSSLPNIKHITAFMRDSVNTVHRKFSGEFMIKLFFMVLLLLKAAFTVKDLNNLGCSIKLSLKGRSPNRIISLPTLEIY